MVNKPASDVGSPDSSKLRLILAAERLFAERGLDAVSLREIAAAAGQGNNNAVQYHFGSREGLILALTGYRVAQLEAPRRRMLEVAERAGLLQDVVTLFEILCLPQADLVDEAGQHPYAHFMSQFLSRHRTRGLAHSSDAASPGSEALWRVVRLIAKRIAHVPSRLITGRIELCNLTFNNMLVRCDNAGLPDRDPSAFHKVVHDTIEMLAAAASVSYRKIEAADCSVEAWLKLRADRIPD